MTQATSVVAQVPDLRQDCDARSHESDNDKAKPVNAAETDVELQLEILAAVKAEQERATSISGLPHSGIATFRDSPAMAASWCKRLEEELDVHPPGSCHFESIDISGTRWSSTNLMTLLDIFQAAGVTTQRFKALKCALRDDFMRRLSEWLLTVESDELPGEVYLSHNDITFDGLESLLWVYEIKSYGSKLEQPLWLRIEGNRVDPARLRALATAGECCLAKGSCTPKSCEVASPARPSALCHMRYGEDQRDLLCKSTVPASVGSLDIAAATSGFVSPTGGVASPSHAQLARLAHLTSAALADETLRENPLTSSEAASAPEAGAALADETMQENPATSSEASAALDVTGDSLAAVEEASKDKVLGSGSGEISSEIGDGSDEIAERAAAEHAGLAKENVSEVVTSARVNEASDDLAFIGAEALKRATPKCTKEQAAEIQGKLVHMLGNVTNSGSGGICVADPKVRLSKTQQIAVETFGGKTIARPPRPQTPAQRVPPQISLPKQVPHLQNVQRPSLATPRQMPLPQVHSDSRSTKRPVYVGKSPVPASVVSSSVSPHGPPHVASPGSIPSIPRPSPCGPPGTIPVIPGPPAGLPPGLHPPPPGQPLGPPVRNAPGVSQGQPGLPHPGPHLGAMPAHHFSPYGGPPHAPPYMVLPHAGYYPILPPHLGGHGMLGSAWSHQTAETSEAALGSAWGQQPAHATPSASSSQHAAGVASFGSPSAAQAPSASAAKSLSVPPQTQTQPKASTAPNASDNQRKHRSRSRGRRRRRRHGGQELSADTRGQKRPRGKSASGSSTPNSPERNTLRGVQVVRRRKRVKRRVPHTQPGGQQPTAPNERGRPQKPSGHLAKAQARLAALMGGLSAIKELSDDEGTDSTLDSHRGDGADFRGVSGKAVKGTAPVPTRGPMCERCSDAESS
eukprot:TRINITY_DN9036_c0_g1_i2.p1 TRINITY_DN9036_c0_g1~~TRINITY_DN9036_c0_g1_i2.p1  ORF type:complete len:915 (-),score=125.17 TRINITY_DN9036_c0_g1_i2:214-2958(-)